MKALVIVAAVAATVCACTLAESPASPSEGPVKLTALSPTSGPRGTAVTLTGTGFAGEGNVLKFGDGYIKNLKSGDGRAIRFAIPDAVDLCLPNNPAAAGCPAKIVTPGTYTVAVVSGSDTSNELQFTVSAQ